MSLLAARQFGLSSDEWSFLGLIMAATVAVLLPLYISQWRGRRDVKDVKHEVSHNGGVYDSPTVKDYAHGAYTEARASRILAEAAATLAESAAEQAKEVKDELDLHIMAAKAQGEAITGRLDAVASDIDEIRARSHQVRSTDEPEETP